MDKKSTPAASLKNLQELKETTAGQLAEARTAQATAKVQELKQAMRKIRRQIRQAKKAGGKAPATKKPAKAPAKTAKKAAPAKVEKKAKTPKKDLGSHTAGGPVTTTTITSLEETKT